MQPPSGRSPSCWSAGRGARSTRPRSRPRAGRARSSCSCRAWSSSRRWSSRRACSRRPCARSGRRRGAARSPSGSPPPRLPATRAMRRSRRRSSSRASGSRCSRSPTARRSCTAQHDEARYAVPASYVLDEDLTQLVPVLHGAAACAATPTQVLRLSGNVPAGATFGFLACPPRSSPASGAGAPTSRPGRARRLPDCCRRARDACGRCTSRRAAPSRSRRPPAVTTSRVQAFFRSALGDYRGPARTHRRRAARRAARADPVPARHARAARPRLPQQRPHRRERRHRHPAERARRAHGSAAPRVDGARRRTRSAAGSAPAASADGRRTLGYLITPDRTAIFRPRQPTDGVPLPVLVTPARRRRGRPARASCRSGRGRAGRRRIVGVDRPLPVGSRRRRRRRPEQASTRLETSSPGLGITDELWLDSATPPSAPALTVTSQRGDATRPAD